MPPSHLHPANGFPLCYLTTELSSTLGLKMTTCVFGWATQNVKERLIPFIFDSSCFERVQEMVKSGVCDELNEYREFKIKIQCISHACSYNNVAIKNVAYKLINVMAAKMMDRLVEFSFGQNKFQ